MGKDDNMTSYLACVRNAAVSHASRASPNHQKAYCGKFLNGVMVDTRSTCASSSGLPQYRVFYWSFGQPKDVHITTTAYGSFRISGERFIYHASLKFSKIEIVLEILLRTINVSICFLLSLVAVDWLSIYINNLNHNLIHDTTGERNNIK